MEVLAQEYTNLQNTLNELMLARQKLETQFQENKIVQDEFEQIKKQHTDGILKELPKIYKQTGSILLPVEFADSQTNVNKRIEFITGEVKRVEEQIKKTNEGLEKKRDELIKLRTASQAPTGA